jgi:quinol monooxygenase YgiN
MESTEKISRYGKLTAKPGKGAELAQILLDAASDLESDPSCELYIVNREAGSPDVIWVTELWRSKADLDASIERIRGSDQVQRTMAIVAGAEMTELHLLGGKGA